MAFASTNRTRFYCDWTTFTHLASNNLLTGWFQVPSNKSVHAKPKTQFGRPSDEFLKHGLLIYLSLNISMMLRFFFPLRRPNINAVNNATTATPILTSRICSDLSATLDWISSWNSNNWFCNSSRVTRCSSCVINYFSSVPRLIREFATNPTTKQITTVIK